MHLQQYFDNVYRPLRLRGRNGNTARLYACTIRALARFLGREPTTDDIADELLLARYLEHRLERHSPYTAEKERTQLLALARLARERGIIAVMPSCPPGILPEPVPHSWSTDELRRLFREAAAMKAWVGPVPESLWWPCVLSICFESGERIGAVMEVERREYRRPSLTFPAGTRKGRRRGRVAYLSAATCSMLDEVLALTRRKPEETLLVWTGARTYLWDRFKEIRRRAGLEGKRLAFQQVRRSAISMFAREGGDPVALGGHSQAATTYRWYVDPTYLQTGPRACDILPRVARRRRAK